LARAKKASRSPGFACSACGRPHQKWAGRCEDCGEWGTVEEVVAAAPVSPGVKPGERPRRVALVDLDPRDGDADRMSAGIGELDRVLGGGLVPGSLVLLGGEPGIGKSTLLIQLAASLARQDRRVLYVAGEESPQQIRLRAERVGAVVPGLELFPAVELETILEEMAADPPALAIVDSVQTLRSRDSSGVPGSAAQLASVVHPFMNMTKALGISTVLVAHVTKDGDIAGPKLLEHMVDVVLYFDGSRDAELRFLRSVKNRFGPAGELGVFRMEGAGLEEVANPSSLFYSAEDLEQPGSCVAAGVEGTRAYLVEVQALVSPAVHAYPRRVAQGYEQGRLTLLASVLERRLGVDLSREDIFAKVVGGLSLREPAMDLALALAIRSSHRGVTLPAGMCFAGEVGLGGELRAVGHAERRVQEAARLGFERIVLPDATRWKGKAKIEVVRARTLAELEDRFF
jgi:DNA repair protein RadA/Sms